MVDRQSCVGKVRRNFQAEVCVNIKALLAFAGAGRALVFYGMFLILPRRVRSVRGMDSKPTVERLRCPECREIPDMSVDLQGLRTIEPGDALVAECPSCGYGIADWELEDCRRAVVEAP